MARRSKGALSTAAGVALLIGMIDLWGNLAATGLVLSMLSVPHVNPPPQNIAEKRVPTSPVALFYQVEWTTNEPHDIDMHVHCKTSVPGRDINAVVNYRQLHDVWLRLSKDDQGRPTPLNVEKVESISDIISVPPMTTCRVNAHLFNSHGGTLPVAGRLVAVHQKDSATLEEPIANVLFSLSSYGEEITLLVSTWDKSGALMKDSIEMYPSVKTVLIATIPAESQGL